MPPITRCRPSNDRRDKDDHADDQFDGRHLAPMTGQGITRQRRAPGQHTEQGGAGQPAQHGGNSEPQHGGALRVTPHQHYFEQIVREVDHRRGRHRHCRGHKQGKRRQQHRAQTEAGKQRQRRRSGRHETNDEVVHGIDSRWKCSRPRKAGPVFL